MANKGIFLSLLRAQQGRLLSGFDRLWRHIFDLFDEELSFVDELFVFCSVLQEMLQKLEESFPVYEKYLLHRNRFVRIGNKDFEDMEAFVLNHLSVISQQVHADLEMLSSVHVRGHYCVVSPV